MRTSRTEHDDDANDDTADESLEHVTDNQNTTSENTDIFSMIVCFIE